MGQLTATKRAIVLNLKDTAARRKAMVAAVTGMDGFRVGDVWYRANDPILKPCLTVDEVNHFGRHRTAVGDVLRLQDLEAVNFMRVQVTTIEMNVPERMSDDDFRSMGYTDSADFAAAELVNISKQLWFFHFQVLEIHIAA